MLIDLYCERVGSGLWQEPVNAMSNAAFLIASWFAWKVVSKRGHPDLFEKWVIMSAALVGIGSLIFHTFATHWAYLTDVVPIWLFVCSYTLLVLYRLNKEQLYKTLMWIVVVLASLGLIQYTSSYIQTLTSSTADLTFNGSLDYLPVIVALCIFTVATHIQRHPISHYLLIATALFCLSLILRTIDLTSCNATHGIGTHFLWHLLNGFVVGVLLIGLIKTLPSHTVSSR